MLNRRTRCQADLNHLPVGCCVVILALLIGQQTRAHAQEHRLTFVDGSQVEGTVQQIDPTGVVSGDFANSGVTLDDLVSIERVNAGNGDATPAAGSAKLRLVSDGEITITAPVSADAGLQFTSATLLSDIPLAAVRAIVWQPSDTVTQAIDAPSTDNDVVFIEKDDQIRGIPGVVEAITTDHVTLNYKGKSRKIGIGKVTAIVMADLQLKPRETTQAKVTLADGGTVKGSIVVFDQDQVRLNVGGTVEVSLPVSSVTRMAILSDRVIYLSDLQPVSSQQRAMFTTDRPWQRDRSVEGRPLTLFDSQQNQKRSYNKGIGTHSWSRLVFANDRNLDRFAATVGIDAETAGRGACRMIVRGDGIELWAADVAARSGIHEVDVDITGIEQVELEVLPGPDFDLADHADWCDARFLKTQ